MDKVDFKKEWKLLFDDFVLGIGLGIVAALLVNALQSHTRPKPRTTYTYPEPRMPTYTRPEPQIPTRSITAGEESMLYRKLLSMNLGNKAQANRLIEYERRLAPYASRAALIQNAIERLDYDRRR